MHTQLFMILLMLITTESMKTSISMRINKIKEKIESSQTMKSLAPNYIPKTPNQQCYVDKMENNTLTFGIGPAGTGKTLLACVYAVEQLKQEKFQKLIITRPIVTVEEDLGYLPGKINKKMEPYMRPIFDIFQIYYSQKTITSMLQSGKIEIAPLAYMRGKTFKNAIIIADEMQNSSPNQMLMITTRLGDDSKMIVTGDLYQSDKMENNGLKDIIEKINKKPQSEISIQYFNTSDIQRSRIVSTILDIYNQMSESRGKTNKDASMIPLHEEIRINKQINKQQNQFQLHNQNKL